MNIPGATPVNPATGVIGAAYTNNDADPNTATTLFDIDTGANRDQTVIQSPANAGQLAATGKLTVDASGAVGFDIYATQRNGTTSSNSARAAIQTSAGYGYYRIELLTGRAVPVGSFRVAVVDVAIPTAQS